MLYTILDVETTGTKVELDEILSFGFMRINSKFEVKAAGTLYFYKPEFDIGKYPACTIHKLTRKFMEPHECEFKDNIKKMYSLCLNSTIVGKNSEQFDMPIIKNFLKRHCPALNPLTYSRSFDVQKEFSLIYKERTGSKRMGTLTEYVELLGISQDDILNFYKSIPYTSHDSMHVHGALYDVIATYFVFKETCKILKLNP